MDQLVRTMEQTDIRKKEKHAQEIDRLCDRRNITINRTTERHHKKKKETRKIIRRKSRNVLVKTTS